MKNLKFTVHEIDEMTKEKPSFETPEYLREAAAVCTVVNEIIKNIKTDLRKNIRLDMNNQTIINLNLEPNSLSDYNYYKLFTNYLRACIETPEYADFEKQVIQKSYSPVEHDVLKVIKENYFPNAVDLFNMYYNEYKYIYRLEEVLRKEGSNIIFHEMGVDASLMADKKKFHGCIYC